MDTLPFVMVGHVDHGKSTLIGRLLYDTGSLPVEKMEEIRLASKDKEEVEFAYVMDHLQEERSRNITIDTAQTFFSTPRREYVLIDAPGHKEFLKNMITGASQARAAVLIVDVALGMEEQTRRHSYLLHLLGLDELIVVINKMDLVDFSRQRFESVKADLRAFLARIKLSPLHVIPISARWGDNVSLPSSRIPWYRGVTFLQALDSFRQPRSSRDKPLRFPIQLNRNYQGRDVLMGRVESGRLQVGDDLLLMPVGDRVRVEEIKIWGKDGVREAGAGESIGVVVVPEAGAARGKIAASPDNPPFVTRSFRAVVFWLDPEPLRSGEKLLWRCATQEISAQVNRIRERIDSSTLEVLERESGGLDHSEVGDLEISTSSPAVVESFYLTPELGRFVLARGHQVVAGGIVTHPEMAK